MDLDKKHHSYESDGRDLVISSILPEDDVIGKREWPSKSSTSSSQRSRNMLGCWTKEN